MTHLCRRLSPTSLYTLALMEARSALPRCGCVLWPRTEQLTDLLQSIIGETRLVSWTYNGFHICVDVGATPHVQVCQETHTATWELPVVFRSQTSFACECSCRQGCHNGKNIVASKTEPSARIQLRHVLDKALTCNLCVHMSVFSCSPDVDTTAWAQRVAT